MILDRPAPIDIAVDPSLPRRRGHGAARVVLTLTGSAAILALAVAPWLVRPRVPTAMAITPAPLEAPIAGSAEPSASAEAPPEAALVVAAPFASRSPTQEEAARLGPPATVAPAPAGPDEAATVAAPELGNTARDAAVEIPAVPAPPPVTTPAEPPAVHAMVGQSPDFGRSPAPEEHAARSDDEAIPVARTVTAPGAVAPRSEPRATASVPPPRMPLSKPRKVAPMPVVQAARPRPAAAVRSPRWTAQAVSTTERAQPAVPAKRVAPAKPTPATVKPSWSLPPALLPTD